MTKKNHIIGSLINCLVSVGCFISIYLCHDILYNGPDNTVIIAAFGASAVLVFSEHTSKVSLIKILLISASAAFIGVSFNLSDFCYIYKISFAIGSCILLLNLTRIHYPPAGAIVLIPIIAGSEIKGLGYMYIIYPTLTGITIIYLFSKLKTRLKYIYNGK